MRSSLLAQSALRELFDGDMRGGSIDRTLEIVHRLEFRQFARADSASGCAAVTAVRTAGR
jgi:hypothetical protein